MLFKKLKYPKEHKFMYKKLIPAYGQADNLQGELLRQAENLFHEARCNGNINWDEGFEFYCDFLEAHIGASSDTNALTSEEKKQVSEILSRLKATGRFADRFNNGEVSDEEFEEEYELRDGLGYTEDDLRIIVIDAVCKFYANNKELIPYAGNKEIGR